ncbi:HD-GYP domain-containing protein [Paenibacillus sp. PAMC21692]|uniref:HD-GYP domain-containing protein n=1 Tax=Paenibacillus sp. PAMC21692 TaxID=2762320 RepID=UPI00164E6C0C|nr:HD domain-containing phosphohydrolase [Paenibacillus sp. PAMC21692]QNK59129.1 HD domain-containing protein [Paenibacillus sp. PAMC21692]
MRKVQLAMAKPGDRIARSIFQENGNVLLGTGVELNERYIERLRNIGIDFLYIEDGLSEDIEPEETIRDETRTKAVNEIYKTMNSFKDEVVSKGRTIAPDIGRNFRAVFGNIMQDLATRPNMLVNLSSIHSMDAYLFQHSFNVAVLSGIMGIAKGFNRNQLEELGVGALLFDIGMTKLPPELLSKTGRYTKEDMELMHSHPKLGFDILRKYHDISIVSAHCALQHHERFNGMGYPRNLKKDEIHIYAQIVGLADTYDALVSPRLHRKRYTTSEAIEFLFASGGTFFDLDLIKLFCSHISVYPVATTLQLNTGQVVVVTENNQLAVHRPKVRVIMEADGTLPKSPYEIELKDQLHITIVKEL